MMHGVHCIDINIKITYFCKFWEEKNQKLHRLSRVLQGTLKEINFISTIVFRISNKVYSESLMLFHLVKDGLKVSLISFKVFWLYCGKKLNILGLKKCLKFWKESYITLVFQPSHLFVWRSISALCPRIWVRYTVISSYIRIVFWDVHIPRRQDF